MADIQIIDLDANEVVAYLPDPPAPFPIHIDSNLAELTARLDKILGLEVRPNREQRLMIASMLREAKRTLVPRRQWRQWLNERPSILYKDQSGLSTASARDFIMVLDMLDWVRDNRPEYWPSCRVGEKWAHLIHWATAYCGRYEEIFKKAEPDHRIRPFMTEDRR